MAFFYYLCKNFEIMFDTVYGKTMSVLAKTLNEKKKEEDFDVIFVREQANDFVALIKYKE